MQIQDFAARAGVTVKALLHYDRLGLLTPPRTSGGHRVYGDAELDRLRRIRALKALGVKLAEMRPLLDANAAVLARELAARRIAIAREQDRLRRADRALALVEESLRHRPADAAGLTRLADAMDLPAAVEALRRYFDEDVWDAARAFYEAWPNEDWMALCRDAAAIDRDAPGAVLDVLRRYNALAQTFWRGTALDSRRTARLHAGLASAWRDRDHWPEVLRRRFADYDIDALIRLLNNTHQPRAAAG